MYVLRIPPPSPLHPYFASTPNLSSFPWAQTPNCSISNPSQRVHLKRLQEICFTRLVLTELPAVHHIATVWEMNDGKSKSVISFVQTD